MGEPVESEVVGDGQGWDVAEQSDGGAHVTFWFQQLTDDGVAAGHIVVELTADAREQLAHALLGLG